MNLAKASIQNRLLVTIVIFISLLGGWSAYQSMPRFEDPEFIIRTAQIMTRYPGANPTEVANELTDELETAIQQMQEVDEIRSTSSFGTSLIEVDIKYEFSRSRNDLSLIWTKLRNRVSDAQANLPPGAETSVVNDDFGDVYGLYYAITGDGFSMEELHEYARRLRTNLLATEGVAKVVIDGVESEGIFVEISRAEASARGGSSEQVYRDLAQQNSVSSGGSMVVDGQRLIIDPSGDVTSVEAIRDLVISTPRQGTTVRLGDIATVSRGPLDPQSFQIRYNGVPALSLGISNLPGVNVVGLGARIEARLDEEKSRRPYGIELHEFYNQAKVVDTAVQDFAVSVFLALVIVLVTLFLFMGPRAAIVIGATLVFTIAATLMVMNLIGIPMHRISLGALIIALGMLVDNGIVVTEGIMVGVAAGRKKLEVAMDVVRRTQWPLLGGTIVGILAFAPIGFAAGSTAEFTNHLFWVVCISLLFSWVFALTLVPFLADLLFGQSAAPDTEKPDRFLALIYKAVIRGALRLRWLVAGLAAAAMVISVWGFQFVKSGFFPASTTPQIVVDFWLPEGADINQTRQDVMEVEAKLAAFEAVEIVQSLIGAGTLRYQLVYSPEAPNASYAQFLLRVADYDAIATLVPQMQTFLDDTYPRAQAKVWRFQLGPGGGSKIEAEFSGPDPVVLRRLANQAKAIMAADTDAIAIQDDWRQLVPVIEPVYNATTGRRLGVSREALADALHTNYSGRSVGVYREGENLIPIIARAPAGERLATDSIASLQVSSQTTGEMVPLLEVIDRIDTVWTDARVKRVDRVWAIQAQADPSEGVLADALLERLRPQIEAITLPPGYALKWNGEYGDSAEAKSNLAATLPLGFAAMVLTVVLLFNSIRQPLLIWLVVPLALVGVILGLVLTGTPMEFMAILGVLSLSGLMIKNAIVLVDQMDLEIREGKPRHDAIVHSAMSRVRPVMMGALTTILGIVPLLSDAFFRSMAVVLIFGLALATIFTLVVVPTFYAILFGVGDHETSIKDLAEAST